MIESTVTVKLKPILTPNYVLIEMPPGKKQDGVKELAFIHVSDLPQASLDSLAAQWLADLYTKAGKPSPLAGVSHD